MITSLRESKAHLSELVERAAKGEEIVITVRGKPKARLCPVDTEASESQASWARRLREARARYSTRKTEDSIGSILEELRGDRE